jgi:hypothetical protein
MLRLATLISLTALSAFSAPITLTIFSGTEQSSASGFVFGPGRHCSASGEIEASCMAFVIGPNRQQYGYGFGHAITSWADRVGKRRRADSICVPELVLILVNL